MLYESLDPNLENGIASICDSDWNIAQDLLSLRLQQSARLGRRRLNLFLLSVVASRVGLDDMAAQLAEAARETPLEMAEPRYFGTSEDPVRRQLEQDWWAFNNWNPEASQLPLASVSLSNDDELNWASVLDGALEGRAGELERRWSRFLDGEHPQRAILWNLVAVGYLESGDVRTYEEMRDQAPARVSPVEVPEVLSALLTHAGLNEALADLENGRWLTSDSLSNITSGHEVAGAAAGEIWEAEMEASFSLLSVGRAVEAARKLGPLCLQEHSHLHRAYALNALALALFSSGEYGGAEEALADSRSEAASAPPESDPELASRFAEWLLSAGAHPLPGSVFCDPFAEVIGSGNGLGATDEAGESFWSGFEQVLEGMRDGDLGSAKRTLRRLLSEPGSKESTPAFLLALLFAGTALLEGDHMEAQEAIDDASRLLEAGGLEAGGLVEAQGRLAAVGAMTLAGKMDLENLPTLDPWRDFPADFGAETYSGY